MIAFKQHGAQMLRRKECSYGEDLASLLILWMGSYL